MLFPTTNHTFPNGIHPHGFKELSQESQIVELSAPNEVCIPLAQHIGKPATAIVSVGETVQMGQKIGEADGFISAHIFSSVSGTVSAIQELPTPTGKCQHIVIQNDNHDSIFSFPKLDISNNFVNLTLQDIVTRAKDAGIVGMGGAGFPTNVKLSPQKPVDTLIINAAECEPYITCDYRIMLDHTEHFLKGSLLIAKSLGLDSVIIGIEDNKPEAISKLQQFCKMATDDNIRKNIQIVSLKAKYPQGGEKQLIYSVTKRKVPVGGLPSDIGICVSNVSTALALYYAVVDGTPLYKRACTVTGQSIKIPQNFWVRVGTPYSHILQAAGGLLDDTYRLISGGPMMGFAVSNSTMYTTKTTSCLLAMSGSQAPLAIASECINCGKCFKACPMNIMPMYMSKYTIADDIDNAIKYGLKNCIECGCCAFVCPAKLPLVQTFRNGKNRARELKK